MTTSNKRGWGALDLTTIGRKSGQERSVILGYLEDGPNIVALAMNGWADRHPSLWLNLEARSEPSFDWRARTSAWCTRARPRGTSVIGFGSAGSQSTRRSTQTPACGRPRRPWSSSNRATGLIDPGEDGSPDQMADLPIDVCETH